MTLEQLAPHAKHIAWGVVIGCTMVGALAASEIVRAFTRPHPPKGEPPR